MAIDVSASTDGSAMIFSPSLYSRLKKATATIARRIFRPKRNHAVDVFPLSLIALSMCIIVLAAAIAVFDKPILLAMSNSQSGFIHFLEDVTDAAKSHFYLIPALIVMTIVSLIDWTKRATRDRAFLTRCYERSAFIFAAIAVPGIAVNIIKQFVGRGRPKTLDEFGPYVFSPFEFDHTFQGFPSGHSATAGSLGMILALYFPQFRWPLLIAFLVLASARIAANAHYPSDVIIGYTIGALGTLAMARWLSSRAVMFRSAPDGIFPTLRN